MTTDTNIIALQFENLLLKAGLAELSLESTILAATATREFRQDRFEDYINGEEIHLSPSEKELFDEVISARIMIAGCYDIARGVIR